MRNSSFVTLCYVAPGTTLFQVEAVWVAASKALVVLATGVSAILVVALEGIYRRVNAVISNNKPSLTVRTHLLELLVSGTARRGRGGVP